MQNMQTVALSDGYISVFHYGGRTYAAGGKTPYDSAVNVVAMFLEWLKMHP